MSRPQIKKFYKTDYGFKIQFYYKEERAKGPKRELEEGCIVSQALIRSEKEGCHRPPKATHYIYIFQISAIQSYKKSLLYLYV